MVYVWLWVDEDPPVAPGSSPSETPKMNLFRRSGEPFDPLHKVHPSGRDVRGPCHMTIIPTGSRFNELLEIVESEFSRRINELFEHEIQKRGNISKERHIMTKVKICMCFFILKSPSHNK